MATLNNQAVVRRAQKPRRSTGGSEDSIVLEDDESPKKRQRASKGNNNNNNNSGKVVGQIASGVQAMSLEKQQNSNNNNNNGNNSNLVKENKSRNNYSINQISVSQLRKFMENCEYLKLCADVMIRSNKFNEESLFRRLQLALMFIINTLSHCRASGELLKNDDIKHLAKLLAQCPEACRWYLEQFINDKSTKENDTCTYTYARCQ